ncbi:MAG: hypothetical protein MJ124_07320 [Lachnospiraceae bacterium]|nr:hypothetical protein [Lachnospiraceae bacterium]
MLKRVAKFFKDRGLGQETINIILGILMLAAFLVYGLTKSVVALSSVIFLGAMMNISQGLAYQKRKDRKSIGMCMILLGVIIIVIYALLVLR